MCIFTNAERGGPKYAQATTRRQIIVVGWSKARTALEHPERALSFPFPSPPPTAPLDAEGLAAAAGLGRVGVLSVGDDE